MKVVLDSELRVQLPDINAHHISFSVQSLKLHQRAKGSFDSKIANHGLGKRRYGGRWAYFL